MSSKYEQLINDLAHPERLKGSTYSGINGYPIVYLKPKNTDRKEIEINPVDGYDSGEPHMDNLAFFVNVIKYNTYDEKNDEWIDGSEIYSHKFTDIEKAVQKAYQKIQEIDS